MSTTHAPTPLEEQVAYYLSKLRQIDTILPDPAISLIQVARETLAEVGGRSITTFPVWAADSVHSKYEENLYTRALCSSTLQRLDRRRGRYPWLTRSALKETPAQSLSVMRNALWQAFVPNKPTCELHECTSILQSESYGTLNPLMAAEVIRVFLNAGEHAAHRNMGLLIFFSVMWALGREFPNPLDRGVGIEPWRPSAYVTAACLLPIRKLQGVCARRAALLSEMAAELQHLQTIVEASAARSDYRSRWEYFSTTERLATVIARLAPLTLVPGKLARCAEDIRALLLNTDDPTSNTPDHIKAAEALRRLTQGVTALLGKTLASIAEVSDVVAIESLLDQVEKEIVSPLEKATGDSAASVLAHLESRFGIRFAPEYIERRTGSGKELGHAYIADLTRAAAKALTICRRTARQIRKVAEASDQVRNVNTTIADIHHTLTTMSEANEELVRTLNDSTISQAAQWCRTVVDRETAHASAGDDTNFDPSEMVCAIAVAVRWGFLTTKLQTSDAVAKALKGARSDGSWAMGRPIYATSQELASWPVTSDTVWMLTGALQSFPEIDVADEALFSYVDWLERTRVSVRLQVEPAGREDVDASGTPQHRTEVTVTGWPSDRLGQRERVHFETTALSVNALMEIQELVEYRLWQLCNRRFTVLQAEKSLDEILPVDLGAQHKHRLHTKLRRAIRGDIRSLVLHGPPGSSKTALAEGIAHDRRQDGVWGGNHPRLVRITPADFTRMGEDRLDSEARLIFDLLSHVRGATILFDEIDDLLRSRDTSAEKPRFMDLVVPAMLNRLQDLRDLAPKQQLCFIIATNYVDRVDPALLRPGRVDYKAAVVYPDFESRSLIVARARGGSLRERAEEVARLTAGWPFKSIDELCEALSAELQRSASATERDLIGTVAKRYMGTSTGNVYHGRPRNWESPEMRVEYVRYVMCATAGDEASKSFDPHGLKDTSDRQVKVNELLEQLQQLQREEGRVIP